MEDSLTFEMKLILDDGREVQEITNVALLSRSSFEYQRGSGSVWLKCHRHSSQYGRHNFRIQLTCEERMYRIHTPSFFCLSKLNRKRKSTESTAVGDVHAELIEAKREIKRLKKMLASENDNAKFVCESCFRTASFDE